MTCTHRLWNEPNGLICTRRDPHEKGHIYLSSSVEKGELIEDQ